MGDEYLVVGRELVKPGEEPEQCEPVEHRPYELTLSVDVDIFGGSEAVALMHCLRCKSDRGHVLHDLVVRGHPQAWITCLTCGDGRPLSWTDIGLDDVDAQEPFFERLIQPACMTERPQRVWVPPDRCRRDTPKRVGPGPIRGRARPYDSLMSP